MPDPTPNLAANRYWKLSQRPAQVFMFLLPVLLLYEVLVVKFGVDAAGMAHEIRAKQYVDWFFARFGIAGKYLPALVIAIVLLSWHVVSKDRWRFAPKVYGWMWVESLGLAVPLLLFMIVISRGDMQQAQASTATNLDNWQFMSQLTFSLGAGLYEELVFRLVLIAVLHGLVVDVLKYPETAGDIVAIIGSAVLFSLYHYSDAFTFTLFLKYSFAGVYFASVYVIRGFGIVVGTHALYDVLVAILRTL